jgi:hypothetical protein
VEELIAMSSPSRQTAIGIEPETQTVTVIFPAPVTYLRLSVEQAESFAKALLEQAKLYEQQIQKQIQN